jgi:hypothetical protein
LLCIRSFSCAYQPWLLQITPRLKAMSKQRQLDKLKSPIMLAGLP